MEYSELKKIFDVKAFNILHNLTNKPKCNLLLPNVNHIHNDIAANNINPFATNSKVDTTSISIEENRVVAVDVKCIYTNDKLMVQENDTSLGSKYSLVIYIRADDIPAELKIKRNISNAIIGFNDTLYPVNNYQNLYDIIYEFRF